MKTVKLFFIILVVFSMIACDGVTAEEAENQDSIEVEDMELLQLIVESDAVTLQSVSFVTTGTWYSSLQFSDSKDTSHPWMSITPGFGENAGTYTLIVDIKANETTESRRANVVISCGEAEITITIEQRGIVHAQPGDYIDEYGVNHGQGIEIAGDVWAPVNCGYHARDYKYGKLYQWGRKYGQGYNGKEYDLNEYVGDYFDAIIPTVSEGPVPVAVGNCADAENVYYKSHSRADFNWATVRDDALWNSGTSFSPIKSEYDPCPSGWRVPTFNELNDLRMNTSDWTISSDGQCGFWCSGLESYNEQRSQVFLPAAGYRSYDYGMAVGRGLCSHYWSSTVSGSQVYRLAYLGGEHEYNLGSRADAYPVRCIKE